MKNDGLRWCVVGLACAGFLLVVAGPRFERSHWAIAGVVAILTLILAIATWLKESRRSVKHLAGWAVATVVVEALLGRLSVWLRLPAAVSVAQACLGQVFFSLLVCWAVLTGPLNPADVIPGAATHTRKLQRLAMMTTGLVFLESVAGATLRQTGEPWAFHLHWLIALAVTVQVVRLCRRVFKHYSEAVDLERPALALLALLGIQWALGFYCWRTGWGAVTITHTAVGALLLATSAVLMMQSFRALVMPP
jgi:heme A synthase